MRDDHIQLVPLQGDSNVVKINMKYFEQKGGMFLGEWGLMALMFIKRKPMGIMALMFMKRKPRARRGGGFPGSHADQSHPRSCPFPSPAVPGPRKIGPRIHSLPDGTMSH